MKLSDPTQMALVLTFDIQTQTRLDQVISGLEVQGITPYPDGMRAPPHITLAAFTFSATAEHALENTQSSGLLPGDLSAQLASLASGTHPIKISLESLGAFNSSQGVVFLAPVVTRQLQDFHSRVQDLLTAYGASLNPYYLPDQWVPHVTLAVEQPPEMLPVIFRACQQAAIFATGMGESLLLADFPPPRQIASYPLRDV
jgi:2'-5' RNA ligase